MTPISPPFRAQLTARRGLFRLEAELETNGPLVLVGPNGAGKSTLLSCLLGIVPGVRGRVDVGDTCLFDSDRGVDFPLESRRLAYLPQDYALFPHWTVRRNIAFAVSSAPDAPTRDVANERVERALRELDLVLLADRRPHELSGGERQRAALARALVVRPRALLLDEPLAALDVHARGQIRLHLAATLGRLAIPSLVVSHDPADARALGTQILVLEAGRVVQLGRWDELVAAPATRFVEEFVNAGRRD